VIRLRLSKPTLFLLMAWIAVCLAVAAGVVVWLWGRSAFRRHGSHADLPNGHRIIPIPTVVAADGIQREDTLGTAQQEEDAQEEEVVDHEGEPQFLQPLVSRADGDIVDPVTVAPTQPFIQSGAAWVEANVEIEAGLGVACAKANHYLDEQFIQAQNHLKKKLNLFLISKDDRDAVLKKECSLLLTSRLADLANNGKIQDAYALGVPVLLAEDVGDCGVGDSLKVYLSPARLLEYQRQRSVFDDNWELVPYMLKGNDRYFLTHSDAGYKLLKVLEDYLENTLGTKQEIKSQSVPKSKEIDFVVVPCLRTTSARFTSVLARENPVLVIRSQDLEGRSVGDEVPAWRWKGGDFFMYPPLKRERNNKALFDPASPQ